jgi:hypothetical protein
MSSIKYPALQSKGIRVVMVSFMIKDGVVDNFGRESILDQRRSNEEGDRTWQKKEGRAQGRS